jgi:hypothetical protein
MNAVVFKDYQTGFNLMFLQKKACSPVSAYLQQLLKNCTVKCNSPWLLGKFLKVFFVMKKINFCRKKWVRQKKYW